jgi:hypothetical protein
MRLFEFGRFAAQSQEARWLPKPETFEFLGFTHISAKSRAGWFKLQRLTGQKRMRAKLREVKVELMRRRHVPIAEQGQWLRSVACGHRASITPEIGNDVRTADSPRVSSLANTGCVTALGVGPLLSLSHGYV